MSEYLLRVEEVRKKFGNQEVLRGVSLNMRKGETKVVIGPSGAGKSTMLRCVNLLIRPDSGKVYLDDQEITAKGVDASRVRGQIGFVFQHFNLFSHLNAIRNVELGLIRVKKMGEADAHSRAKAALEDVGITEDLFTHYPAQMSGGQQQRVAIARAFAMEPKIILLDEPTSALDPELIGEVLRVMEKLAQEKSTLLAVTHEMGFARKAADEILFMDNGVVVESGRPADLLSHPQQDRTKRFLGSMRELYGESEGG